MVSFRRFQLLLVCPAVVLLVVMMGLHSPSVRRYMRTWSLTRSGVYYVGFKGSTDQVSWLSIYDGQSIPSVAEFPYVKTVETVDMARATLDVDSLPRLSCYPNLNCLDLSGSDLSDDVATVLAEDTSVKVILARDTNLSDIGLVLLAEIKDLRGIDVSNTLVTHQGIAACTRDHPQLSIRMVQEKLSAEDSNGNVETDR